MAKKVMVKEGLKRLVYGVRKVNPQVIIGMVGITPRFHEEPASKRSTVNFNRNLASAVKEVAQQDRKVYFLPLHLHFLSQQGTHIQPVHKYFHPQGEFTVTGGLVLQQVVFQELGMIPLSRDH